MLVVHSRHKSLSSVIIGIPAFCPLTPGKATTNPHGLSVRFYSRLGLFVGTCIPAFLASCSCSWAGTTERRRAWFGFRLSGAFSHKIEIPSHTSSPTFTVNLFGKSETSLHRNSNVLQYFSFCRPPSWCSHSRSDDRCECCGPHLFHHDPQQHNRLYYHYPRPILAH